MTKDSEGHSSLESLVSGGLPQLLLGSLGKHASDAIGQLISGAVGIPVAKLNAYRRRIDDDADARSLIKGAQARTAAGMVEADPELSARAIDRWLGRQHQKQANVEAVARAALEDLQEQPAKNDEPIQPDFLNRFQDLAEGASSAEMQALFGRILAGEVRAPGSFSLASLHCLSVLDKALAERLQIVKSWLLNKQCLPANKPFSGGKFLETYAPLMDLGLLRPIEMSMTSSPKAPIHGLEKPAWPLVTSNYVFFVQPRASGVCSISYYAVTPTGAEVFSVVPDIDTSPESARAMMEALQEQGAGAVHIATRSPKSGPKGVAWLRASIRTEP